MTSVILTGVKLGILTILVQIMTKTGRPLDSPSAADFCSASMHRAILTIHPRVGKNRKIALKTWSCSSETQTHLPQTFKTLSIS